MSTDHMSQQKSAWERAHRAAELIEQERARAIPKLTRKEAGRRAGISAEWWTACATGDRAVGGGQRVLVTPPDDTLVLMARAVGVEDRVRTMLGLPDIERPDTEEGIEEPPDIGEQLQTIISDLGALYRRYMEEVEGLRTSNNDQGRRAG